MAFKTAAEMFGDGSGGNPQVPIDLGAPPGYNAANRGVAFGEQVTSSIKNRTPYALVLNDEDLNDRLAEFETSGLDAAYDLGAVGLAGGGRVITKDGGAVEIVSAHSSIYSDDIANALLRVDSLADSAAMGAVGVDCVGTTGYAGVLVRQRFVYGGVDSQVSVGEAATLNPGGVNGALVRLTGGGFFRDGSGNSEVRTGHDLILITGTASSDGIYKLHDPLTGPNEQDCILRTLGNGTPIFTSDETCTVTVFRPYNRIHYQGQVLQGFPGNGSVVDLLAGKGAASVNQGAQNALRSLIHKNDGTQKTTFRVDYAGRLVSALLPSDLEASDDGSFFVSGAPFTARSLNGSAPVASHVVRNEEGSTGPDIRYDFLSLREAVFNTGVTFTFSANSPVDGRIDGGGSESLETVTPFSVVMDATGIFYIVYQINTGSNLINLRLLDGTVPSFPTSGTRVFYFFHAHALGMQTVFPVANLEGVVNGWEEARPTAMFTAPEVDGSSALTAVTVDNLSSTVNNALFRGFQGYDLDGAGTDAYEVVRIEASGRIITRSSVEVQDDVIVGVSGVSSNGHVRFIGTQPSAGANPGTNRAEALNQCKVWAKILVQFGSASIVDSYGVASVAIVDDTQDRITVTFSNAFANDDYAYCVIPQSNAIPDVPWVPWVEGPHVLTTSIGFSFYDLGISAYKDLTSDTVLCSVFCFGRQA